MELEEEKSPSFFAFKKLRVYRRHKLQIITKYIAKNENWMDRRAFL